MRTVLDRIRLRTVIWYVDQRGGSLIEYALLIAFIALAAIFAVTQVGEKTLSNLSDILPIEPRN